jgi:hypothetical protein
MFATGKIADLMPDSTYKFQKIIRPVLLKRHLNDPDDHFLLPDFTAGNGA